MWHLKTKVGTFWIVPSEENQKKYYLGFDDDPLGTYDKVEMAVEDVLNHSTGSLPWDESNLAKVPVDIALWNEGLPHCWSD